ncbi:MAG: hypothetical protein QXW47_11195 [Candidatus Jordarchaeales archaeon]
MYSYLTQNPSHYIYTACPMACLIYKSFRKLKGKNKVRLGLKPLFRKDVIVLDDHLFSMNLDKWEAPVATEAGRIVFRILHGTCHEKFRGMKVGQAWLVRRRDGHYLKVVFSKTVEVAEPNGKKLAIDVNEAA